MSLLWSAEHEKTNVDPSLSLAVRHTSPDWPDRMNDRIGASPMTHSGSDGNQSYIAESRKRESGSSA